jgi:hypothetical protein
VRIRGADCGDKSITVMESLTAVPLFESSGPASPSFTLSKRVGTEVVMKVDCKGSAMLGVLSVQNRASAEKEIFVFGISRFSR